MAYPGSKTWAQNVYYTAVAVTTSDVADVANGPYNALYIGTAGTLKVTLEDGVTTVSFGAVVAGLLPLAVKRVWATGTTAANIVALS